MVTLPTSWGDQPVNDNDPSAWGDTPVDGAPAAAPRKVTANALATTFGYKDREDNGVGAWGDQTNNPEIVGVSLPRSVLRERFGDEDKAHGKKVRVTNPETGQSIIAPIVDKGPADWVVERQGMTIDLTHAANQAIGGTGKTPVHWEWADEEGGTNGTGGTDRTNVAGDAAAADGPLAWGDEAVGENHDVRNAFVTGALDQGFYSGVEGATRMVSNTLKQLPREWGEASVRAAAALNPLGLALQAGEMATGGPRTSYRDAAVAGLEAYAGGAADVRKDVREAFPVTPEFQKSLGGQIISGFGQAVGTLPTYVIPGFGPASSVGMIYDQGYQDALQAGVSPAEAHKAAMMNVPSAALEYAADKLVIGRILKPLRGKITVGQLLQSVGMSAATGGATEAAQQAWQNLVAKRLAGYDPNRALDDGVIDSLIVGAIVDSGVTAAGSGATMAAERGARPPAVVPDAPGLGEIRVTEDLPAEIEGLFAEEVPVEDGTNGADVTDGTDVVLESAPVMDAELSPAADRARVVDENLDAMARLRALKQEQAAAAADPVQASAPVAAVTNEWGDAPVESPAPVSDEARAAEQAYRDELEDELRGTEEEMTIGLDDALRRAGGLPGKRSPHWQEWAGELGQLWEARQGARQAGQNPRAFQNLFRDDAGSLDTVAEALREDGFEVQTADDVFALVDQWLRTGREPRTMRNFQAQVDIPFSKTLGISTTLPEAEAAPMAKAIREAYEAAGIRNVPPVRLVQTVDEIPEHLGGRDARNAVAQGSIVEAFFDPRPGQRGITIVMDGAAQIADQRGLTLEQRVKQLGLHEIVHHYQTLGALLPKSARKEYNDIVEGVLGYIPEAEREQLAELYGFDLSKPRGRAALAEEYLARFHEGQTTVPTWVQRVWARVLALLRKHFPGMRWTDADLRGLLDAARRQAETMTTEGEPISIGRAQVQRTPETRVYPTRDGGLIGPALFSIQAFHGTPHKVDRFSTEKIGTGEGNQSYGWGLYFAEHPAVAEEYARSVRTEESEELAARAFLQAKGIPWTDSSFMSAAGLAELHGWDRDAQRGNLYTVKIIPDTEQLLDWDLPINEHSEEVRQKLRPYFEFLFQEGKDLGTIRQDATFEEFHRSQERFMRGLYLYADMVDTQGGPRKASEYLAKLGVPGIRFLDQGSRAKGGGTYNFVVFRDADIQITQENGQPVAAPAFSQQVAEEAAQDPQKRREFIQSVKDSPFVKADIKDKVESLYTPITNKETVAEAQRQINTLGIDRALADVLATNANNPPTALANAMGIELLGRLQAMERYADAGQLVEHMAAQATTQGQAIQALSLLARLSPEGVQMYAQKQVRKVAKDNPEMQKLMEEIQKLREELAKAKKVQGTKAVVDLQDALKALKLTPEKLAEINTKIRSILTTSIGTSGYARSRIVGVLVAAGMDNKKAKQLAERALKAFEREAKLARDKVLRQLLKQQVRDAIHGPAISAADAMQDRLEKLFYANPGSVWGRYKKQAVEALASKMTEAQAKRDVPALQEFTGRLIKQLQAILPPEALADRPDLGPNPTPEAAYIGEAIRNFDKYQDVWTAAQDFIRDKYRNDDFTLTQLDGYLGQILARPFSPTSLTKAVDQTLRSLNVRIGDLLLRSKGIQGKTAELVAKMITDQARVDGDHARQLADDVLREVARQTQAARESFAKRLLTPKERRSGATKSELQRWVELNNSGLLDDDALLEQIAERRGLPLLTREKAREIQSLQAEYAAAPDGVVKLVKAAEMLDRIHSTIPSDGWSKARAAQNISMLLNPKTIGRNVIGNAAMWVGNTVADGVSAAVDPLVSVVTGKSTAPSFYLAARLRGLAAPVNDYRAGRDHARAQGAEKWASVAAGLKTMVEMARLTSAGKYDVHAVGQTHRHVFSSRVGRLFEDVLSGALGTFDRAFHQSAYLAALEREMRSRGEMVPTEESVTLAQMAAAKAVYQDENFVSKYLGQGVKAVNRLSTMGLSDRYGLGTIIMPFTQVPGSLLLRGAEWSPIGFIRTGYEVFRPVFGREFRQRDFVDAFSRAALGSGAMALGFWLFKLGVLSGAPEDDKDREAMRRASGLGSYRINVSELKRRFVSGNWRTPASQLEAAQDGDVIVNYDWLQPSAVPVAMGAQMAENEEQARREMAKGKVVELPSVAITMASAGVKTLEDQPLLSGVFRFAGDISRAQQQGDGTLEAVGRVVFSVPGNFIPGTLFAQIGQMLDNTPRETRGGSMVAQELNKTLARVPGFSERFPARYDIFGEAQERYQYGRNSLFNVLLNPAFVTEVRRNPLATELERIYQATGDATAVPRAVDRRVTVNGKQLELTNEQISEYQRYTGKLTVSIFSQLIAAPGYARLPDAEKARILAGVLGDVNTAAKQELFGQPAVTVDRRGGVRFDRHAILFRALARARGIARE